MPYGTSLWADGVERVVRPPLPGDTEADVVIVGAGYTGLWTAWHVLRLAPGTRVMVLEAEHVGFGASGRNGGWAMAELAHDYGDEMHKALVLNVDDLEAAVAEHDLDCDFARNGELMMARNAGQERRLKASLGPDDTWLDADEARACVNATDLLGAVHVPHTAVVHPAKLAHEIARIVEAAGGVIHEGTRVIDLDEGRVTTEHGAVRCEQIVLATEAYAVDLSGHERSLIPLYSLMVATEPLSDAQWADIGLAGRELFADARFRIIYGQRTADGRLAFGGRSADYRFRSEISAAAEDSETNSNLASTVLFELFPQLEGTAITHRWGGVLGVPRNWKPSVTIDPQRRIHRAGGYVGDGVAATHLAGRTLAHAITGIDDECLRLPWVRPWSRNWPVEPFRYAGYRLGAEFFLAADRLEFRGLPGSRLSNLVWNVLRR